MRLINSHVVFVVLLLDKNHRSYPPLGMREDAMKKILPWVAIFAAAVMIVAVPSPRAAKDSTSDMKQLMGENFQNLQLILSNLITSDYGNLRERIKTINEHAVELGKFPRAP